MTYKLLIAEDSRSEREFLAHNLRSLLGYNVAEVENGQEALEYIRVAHLEAVDAVLLDVHMPLMGGMEALQQIKHLRPDLPILLLTGDDDVHRAVEAIKKGAMDYITKPIDITHLGVTLSNAIKTSLLAREVTRLRRNREGTTCFSDLIGYEGGLQHAVAIGKKAALSEVPVLLLGETGVGKELFARALHGESRRSGAPFIAVNCGAIPENLVESTLFGHEKGAFTGAITHTLGKFREANGGTIFLDEVGELPLETKVKLLRVLQQKEVEPVGGGQPIKVDIRLISATNRNLKREVQQGLFREDLFFRLNVLSIELPPLRQRVSDIIELAEYFANNFSAAQSLPQKQLTEDAKEYLTRQPWSGNVRELENMMHRAQVLCEGEDINLSDIIEICSPSAPQPALKPIISHSNTALPPQSTTHSLTATLQEHDGAIKPFSQIEKEIIEKVLSHYAGNVTQAARALHVAKSTFYRKLKDSR